MARVLLSCMLSNLTESCEKLPCMVSFQERTNHNIVKSIPPITLFKTNQSLSMHQTRKSLITSLSSGGNVIKSLAVTISDFISLL